MSQGRTTNLTKEDIATITGDDWYFGSKLIRKLERHGWEKTYNSIRRKDES